MAGTWLLGEQKIRPGTYFRVSSGDVTTVGAVNGIAAILFKATWGELNKVVDIDQSQMNDLPDLFGSGAEAGAIKELLLGGASMVKAVRIGNDDGVTQKLKLYSPTSKQRIKYQPTVDANGEVDICLGRLKKVVNVTKWKVSSNGITYVKGTDYTLTETKNTEGTEYTVRKIKLTAEGLSKIREDNKITVIEEYNIAGEKVARIQARFVGDKPINVSLKTNLVTGKRQMIFYDGTRAFDSVEFEAGGDEVQSLKEALETNKNFKVRNVYGSGLLSDFAMRAMYEGTNPTVNVNSYSKGLDLLERHYWNVVVAASNSNSVKTLLSEFVKQSYETGRLGMAVIGGLYTETLDDRMAYATALNDWRVVYVLNGWTDLNGVKYTGWRSAARIGGMIAGCETNASLTHIVINNALSLLDDMTNGEMIQAEQRGCLVLSLNDEGQVWIDNSINSLVTLGNDQDEGWKKIRRTKCRFELMTRINRTCDRLIGRLNNDTNGRATLITAMQSIINEMIAEGKLFFGSYVAEDTRYKPAGDKAYFVLFIGDIDSIEKIYLDFNFSYANPFE